MRTSTRLRQMIEAGEQFVGPGVYDPLSAKVVADLGFNGVYLGGFASAASMMTMEPLMTMTEQVGLAASITKVIGDVPLIVDGHTAYGEPVHVTRAVREFEAAGVAGIHIEDQFFPKRASYHKGLKHMVPVEVMQERIDAALRARRDPDFFIVARTEARGAVGGSLDEVIRRLQLYAEAGADAVMPMPYGGEEGKKVADAITDTPLMWFSGAGSFAEGAAELHVDELMKIGYQIVAYPIAGLVRSIEAVHELYAGMKADGLVEYPGLDEGYERIMQLIEAPAFYEIEARTTEKS